MALLRGKHFIGREKFGKNWKDILPYIALHILALAEYGSEKCDS
jgi:hypothetical protein